MAIQARARASGANPSARGGVPARPTGLSAGSWLGVLKRTVREFRADNLTDLAAALTYYGVLAIFPALIALAPGPLQQILTSATHGLQRSRGAAGVIFVAGVAGALWSASGYVAAFMRASNRIYDIEEGRPIWVTVPVRVVVTIVRLLGAEFNAELERGRQIEAGHPADRQPFVEPRKAVRT